MLPLIGVGSAIAIFGLCAARRPARPSLDAGRERRMSSGVHPRVNLNAEAEAELAAVAPELTSDFWDASPDSYALPESHGRPPGDIEAYDALDPEDLSAEWLTRATEAPAGADYAALDLDDPAEIPADSMSMISDASRHAAALDVDALDEDTLDEEALDEEALDRGERAADSRV
jgi:hypothetical protein